MTVSFMHCCKKLLSSAISLLALLWLGMAGVQAEGIAVQKAEGRMVGSNYQLSVDFDINFNYVVEQALMRGVTLHFISEFNLNRPRWYWFDDVLVESEQTTRLSYNALTRQYRIGRGSLFQNFANLEDALRVLGHQSSTPVPLTALKSESKHVVSARMRLDITQLPKPLQVNALTSKEWNLDSDWYSWIVHPNTAGGN
jgi:hypothetical protein